MVDYILTLIGGKLNTFKTWEVFLFYKRTFTDVEVPEDKVLTMHSPVIDGCLTVDGEVFIE